MPLIVLSGQPASGKSTAAAQLRVLLLPHGPVQVVDEASVNLDRNVAYSSSHQEKIARASLKSAVERVLSKDTYVILDSLNNIKGYRYEMWCAARSVPTRYCVVHVDTPVEICRQWNDLRPEHYTPNIFDDLVRRFETPDSRNRWDAPLFALRPAGESAGHLTEVLEAVTAVMTGAAGAPGSAAGAAAATGQVLKPTFATTNPGILGTNVLHEIDSAAQAVVNAINDAQAKAGGGPAALVDLGTETGTMQLDRLLPLAELRRHKRSFLKLVTKMTFSRIADAATAQRLFIDYLKQQL